MQLFFSALRERVCWCAFRPSRLPRHFAEKLQNVTLFVLTHQHAQCRFDRFLLVLKTAARMASCMILSSMSMLVRMADSMCKECGHSTHRYTK